MSWMKKLLRINLSTASYIYEDIPLDILISYIGGKGLGTYYFFQEVPATTEPLSPENAIYIIPGVFSGTSVPASSRFHVVTKSPLTNICVDASSGGHFGPELRSFGVDMVVLEGKSDSLVGLHLQDNKVEFIDAHDYKGLGIY
ncbi:MAG: aldehyde:ferredoxin oxidoreductase, partial [Spirochaetia bacterium]|nr:aldehyde:ferredoxin oxidoreductase [Spirochaetia bacterium]